MFTSKKDGQIETLEKQIQVLNKKIASLEKSWLECRKESEKKDAEILDIKTERSEMQEYYSTENARLRRMIKSEKERRINNQNANKRKIKKLTKTLEA